MAIPIYRIALLAILGLFNFGLNAFAFDLPRDTVTFSKYVPANGAGTYIIENTNNTKTVLSLSFLQSALSSNTRVVCGTYDIFNNFAKDVPMFQVNYVCNLPLTLVKTGNDEGFAVVNYVMRDRNLSYDPSNTEGVPQTITASFNTDNILLAFGFFIFLSVFYFFFKLFQKKYD